MQKLIRNGPLGAILVGLCACQSPEFAPIDAEPANRRELAAEWQDLTVAGTDLGDLKVWSTGRPEPPAQGVDDDRQVEVALRIKNDGVEPLRLDLDATRLELHTKGERFHVIDRPLEVRGPTSVAPGQVERVELIYALPVKLGRVTGFELAWVIAAPPASETTSGQGSLPAGASREPTVAQPAGERRISRSSTFSRIRRPSSSAYDPYWGYYDHWGWPYDYYDPWYGPYGFYWGYGSRWDW